MRKQYKNHTQCLLLAAICAVIIAVSGSSDGMVSAVTEREPVQAPIYELGEAQVLANLRTNETSEAEFKRTAQYTTVSITDEERDELAGIIYLEAGNQCTEGQQAVAEVVFNRVISADFPDSVHDVLHQGEGTSVPQFSTVSYLHKAEPTAAQYEAIDAALSGPSILPMDVVYFSRNGENDRVWGAIEDHIFCYGYVWE